MLFIFAIFSYQAMRIENPPIIDGILSDSVWAKATFVDSFVQTDPQDNATPTQHTEFAVLYNNDGLYIGIRCYDTEPEKIVARLSRRDEWVESDIVSIEIDSYHQGRNAYNFSVNAAGVKGDAYLGENTFDEDWNGEWEAKAYIGNYGWSSEFFIPFNTLRFKSKEENAFGIKISRYISRLKESDEYPYIKRADRNHLITHFAVLSGLKGIPHKQSIDFLPYVRFSLSQEKTQKDLSVGIDYKWHIRSNIILDGALNPDFGQVEADPAELNLSTYETYFEEKRPFFMEGKDFFSTYFQLFYSRRIGQIPYYYPSRGDSIIDIPDNTTILNALKLIGKTDLLSFGVISAITDEEFARLDSSGIVIQDTIVPERWYNVLRAKYNIGKYSYIGIIGTDQITKNIDNQVYTGGIDWKLCPNKYFSYKGMIAGSDVGEKNYGTYNALSYTFKNGGFSAAYTYIEPGFNITDMGYMWRDNLKALHINGYLYTTKPFGIFRHISGNLGFNKRWDFDGYTIGGSAYPNINIAFQNNWGIGFGGFHSITQYDDRLSRGGPPIKFSPTTGINGWIMSDNSKPVSLFMFYGTGSSECSEYYHSNATVRIRFSNYLNISIGPELDFSSTDREWVENRYNSMDTTYIFGTLKRNTISADARVNYTVNRNLTLQLWTEPYISTGDYSGFKRLDDPDIPSFIPDTVEWNPDFKYNSLKIHFVLRYEYHPGSEFYFVYTKDYGVLENTDDPSFRWEDLSHLYREEGDEVWLLKINYRFSI